MHATGLDNYLYCAPSPRCALASGVRTASALGPTCQDPLLAHYLAITFPRDILTLFLYNSSEELHNLT